MPRVLRSVALVWLGVGLGLGVGAACQTHASSEDDAGAVVDQVVVPESPALTGRLACIAWVESRNDPNATNPRTKAAGLFQFLHSTWLTTPQGQIGLSPYDPVAATDAARWMVAQGRIREWVAVSGGYC